MRLQVRMSNVQHARRDELQQFGWSRKVIETGSEHLASRCAIHYIEQVLLAVEYHRQTTVQFGKPMCRHATSTDDSAPVTLSNEIELFAAAKAVFLVL